jgi:aldose 1-epimerase
MAESTDLVTLRLGGCEVQLSPATGGSIARFRVGGFDIVRAADETALAERNPRGTGGFPMVPFAGRIADGKFSFAGQPFQLALNFGSHPNAIHGNGWQRPWRVAARQGTRSATLVLEHKPERDGAESWPFAYRAALFYSLAGDGMSVTMTLENEDARPWPAGMGLHPYFVRTPDTTLRAHIEGMWRASDTLIPLEHVPVPTELDFGTPKPMDTLRCDGTFTGWDGYAEIAWPSAGRRLVIGAPAMLDTLVVYSPAEPKVLCVEPQSHAPNVVNRAAAGEPGYRVLAPGEAMQAEITFTLQGLG